MMTFVSLAIAAALGWGFAVAAIALWRKAYWRGFEDSQRLVATSWEMDEDEEEETDADYD
jgi:hypothetical protein